MRTMRINGAHERTGFFTGFDYENQNWYATDPDTIRDETKRSGSASNPIAHLPDNAIVISDQTTNQEITMKTITLYRRDFTTIQSEDVDLFADILLELNLATSYEDAEGIEEVTLEVGKSWTP